MLAELRQQADEQTKTAFWYFELTLLMAFALSLPPQFRVRLHSLASLNITIV
jgi:hypothetical protein